MQFVPSKYLSLKAIRDKYFKRRKKLIILRDSYHKINFNNLR